jgi:hypothetical protein
MNILSTKHTYDNRILTLIIDYKGRLFRINNVSPAGLYIWSGINGWLFIELGEYAKTEQEIINQFIKLMDAYTNEEEKETK